MKHILLKLLDRHDLLALLSSEYCEGDEQAFKKTYGVSSKEANKALSYLIMVLKGEIK